MATLVSTGQITIVDNNDAKPITAYLTLDSSDQQISNTQEGTPSGTATFVPDWYTYNSNAGITIIPKVYVGSTTGAVLSTHLLTNKRWGTTVGGNQIYNGTTTTPDTTNFVDSSNAAYLTPFTVSTSTTVADSNYLRVRGNLKPGIPPYIIVFEGDYTDPTTRLTSHIVCQMTLTTIQTGTNASFIVLRGSFNIEQATGTTKNVVAVAADLVRAGGTIDTSNLTYMWYDTNGGTQISTSTSGYATKYQLANTTGPTPPTALSTVNGTNIPALGSSTAVANGNTLNIHETAVANLAIFRVAITDSNTNITYNSYFTVYDSSDPYMVQLVSTSGDKLQNGTGSTKVYPRVFYGSTEIADATLANYTFLYSYYNRDGNRAAFVDPAKTVATGYPVASNTAGSGGVFNLVFTYAAAAPSIAAGDIIKVIDSTGIDYYFEVSGSITGTQPTYTIPVRTATTNSFLTAVSTWQPNVITLNQFATTGKVFICKATQSGTSDSIVVSGSTKYGVITVTGDDIDAKGKVSVDVSKP